MDMREENKKLREAKLGFIVINNYIVSLVIIKLFLFVYAIFGVCSESKSEEIVWFLIHLVQTT